MVYRSLVRPILFRLPPETAHELALHSLPLFSKFVERPFEAPALRINRFDHWFANPVGLAAGFDKDGVALESLAALGFGFIEAGTVTYHAQPGNPKPRMFRLAADQALINRAGFNNAGAAAFVRRVERHRPDCVLGISIGKSKITPLEEATSDYLASFDLVYKLADYVAINVSSPNTPQLRELQQSDQLTSLLVALQTRNRELQARYGRLTPLPLLVKISPDLERRDLEMIVDVIERLQIDGIIATNTTVSRDNLQTDRKRVEACGAGGLSGKPLTTRATQMIAELYQLTGGRIPLIGVGGIFTAQDAWEKICAGASLIQVYTGFIYKGPRIVRQINEGLVEILRREGFAKIDEAVGSRAKGIQRNR
ncbi:MAG TPA: quinone-dependent dihydroorotate dehydrogenase [Pyrinomonadaceae bacterium]|nr:quinone-dependent dihydroorotate dehydrogenase [Pyrinomonadaceae bacterium]